MNRPDKLPPIQWKAGNGQRNTNVNAIVTELVKQSIRQGVDRYPRSEVEKAIRAMADVGDPDTIDGYVEDIGRTDAIKPVRGVFHVTEEAKSTFRDDRGK